MEPMRPFEKATGPVTPAKLMLLTRIRFRARPLSRVVASAPAVNWTPGDGVREAEVREVREGER